VDIKNKKWEESFFSLSLYWVLADASGIFAVLVIIPAANLIMAERINK
jgi:hypothetical protein